MSLRKSLLVTCFVSAVTACGGGGQVEPISPAVRAALSGSWTLNAGLSDNPQEALRRGATGARRPTGGRSGGAVRGGFPGGRRGGAGGRGGRGSGAPAAGGQPNAEAMRALMSTLRPAQRMILELTDSAVSLRTGRGEPLVLTLDGTEVEIALPGDRTLKAKAEWKDDRLVVRRDISGVGTVTESYALIPDTGQLEVEVSSRIRGRGISMRRVYDPESG
jgi:hypothetical protein